MSQVVLAVKASSPVTWHLSHFLPYTMYGFVLHLHLLSRVFPYSLDIISDRQTLSQSIVAALGGQTGEVVRYAGTDRPKMSPRSC